MSPVACGRCVKKWIERTCCIYITTNFVLELMKVGAHAVAWLGSNWRVLKMKILDYPANWTICKNISHDQITFSPTQSISIYLHKVFSSQPDQNDGCPSGQPNWNSGCPGENSCQWRMGSIVELQAVCSETVTNCRHNLLPEHFFVTHPQGGTSFTYLHYNVVLLVNGTLFCECFICFNTCSISVSDICDIPENIKFCKSLQVADFSSNPLSR